MYYCSGRKCKDHIVRGGIDRGGGARFRPRFVGVVDVWKGFWFRDGTLSSPGAAGPRRCPEGKLSPSASSILSLGQIINHPLGLGFPHLAGPYQPGGSPCSSPGCWIFICTEGLMMGPYLPRVRRDLAAGATRRALAP